MAELGPFWAVTGPFCPVASRQSQAGLYFCGCIALAPVPGVTRAAVAVVTHAALPANAAAAAVGASGTLNETSSCLGSALPSLPPDWQVPPLPHHHHLHAVPPTHAPPPSGTGRPTFVPFQGRAYSLKEEQRKHPSCDPPDQGKQWALPELTCAAPSGGKPDDAKRTSSPEWQRTGAC